MTLDRPEALNALIVASKQELLAAFERVAADRARPCGRADRRRAGILLGRT